MNKLRVIQFWVLEIAMVVLTGLAWGPKWALGVVITIYILCFLGSLIEEEETSNPQGRRY